MRFKKGSKVEVMNKEVPASWHVAEIVSENGRAYNVRYDGRQGVEKVSRRFIRPCPPPANGSQRLVAGDIVEVFDANSWKIATVSKVLRGGRLLVRPHGFTHEINVYKKNVRARQSWRDDQWIPVGKISGSYEDVRFGKAVEPNCSVKMGFQVPLAGSKICQEEDDCLPVYNDARLQESHAVSKKLKRTSPFCSSLLEGTGRAKKFKAAEKGCSQRHVSGHSFNQSHNWRHASLASKGPNKILVLLPFSWKKQWDIFSINLLQIRQFVAIGTYLNNKKDGGGSLISHHCRCLTSLADCCYFRPALIFPH